MLQLQFFNELLAYTDVDTFEIASDAFVTFRVCAWSALPQESGRPARCEPAGRAASRGALRRSVAP